ncbi:MAG: HAMP domain-containing histidine kinase [Lachnospiraceae bacterium]|nr:HAMP domain-containing histidine kinase [Lachnospiraceae bacterium]
MRTDENRTKKIKLTDFDHTPIELLIFIAVVTVLVFIVAPVSLGLAYIDEVRTEAMDLLKNYYVYIILGIVVFLFDIIMLGLYYSLVRRIKAGHIWKQSLLYKFIQWCKQGLYSIYDNGNVLLKSVVPYIGLILVNLVLLITAFKGRFTIPSILSLILIDVLAGVFIFKQVNDRGEIVSVMKKIISGDLSQGTDTSKYHGDNKELSEAVNSIGGTIRGAVEQSMKDERMRTDLVANVSHDIRTPLTSIINYVDLIKRENTVDPKIREYVDVIDEKSQRLKTLTDDLIEVSKVSSGNVELELMNINLPEMVTQALAEFDDKLKERKISVVVRSEGLTNPQIMADGKSLWRVMENLLGNICKYTMTGSRAFIDIVNYTDANGERILLRMRNMSETPLPEDLSELTERFIRGDESRTGEGSGLGLSIAKSLTELMGGTFGISSEADLFIADISFNTVK